MSKKRRKTPKLKLPMPLPATSSARTSWWSVEADVRRMAPHTVLYLLPGPGRRYMTERQFHAFMEPHMARAPEGVTREHVKQWLIASKHVTCLTVEQFLVLCAKWRQSNYGGDERSQVAAPKQLSAADEGLSELSDAMITDAVNRMAQLLDELPAAALPVADATVDIELHRQGVPLKVLDLEPSIDKAVKRLYKEPTS